MDGTGGFYAKRNKSVRERQIYDFTHKWNLRYKTDEHRKVTQKYIKTGRGAKHKRLLNIENKQRITGGVVGRGMG